MFDVSRKSFSTRPTTRSSATQYSASDLPIHAGRIDRDPADSAEAPPDCADHSLFPASRVATKQTVSSGDEQTPASMLERPESGCRDMMRQHSAAVAIDGYTFTRQYTT